MKRVLMFPDQARDYLARMNEASFKLGTMIDGLLKLGQFGQQALNLHPVLLNSVVREVQAELIQGTAGRNIDWRISELPSVNCDASLIKVVFVNLLSNALKFTRRQSCAVIEVGCAIEDGEQVIFVADNGEGFDMRHAENLFRIFQRLHPKEQFEGMGIGLATVQRVILRHGGRIWASAEGGKGARFCFTLPPADTPEPQPQERTANIPVLFLTARRQESDVARGFGYGADDYLMKPFNPFELSIRLERIMSLRPEPRVL